LLDDPRDVPIVSPSNEIVGKVHINIVPCTEDGSEDIPEEELPEDPSELCNRPIDFKVKITHLSNLPENFGRNIFCEYKFYLDDQKYLTSIQPGNGESVEFDYQHHHHYEIVTNQTLKYL